MERPALGEMGRVECELAGIFTGNRAFTGPEHVTLDLTNRCNNNCLGCWTRSPLLGSKGATAEWLREEMPTGVAQGLISELAALGTRTLRFTGGGEPFVHPHIMELLSHGCAQGIRVAVTTNGTMLNQRRVDWLVDMAVAEVTASLWAARPSTYSRLHPNKSERTFRRITEGLERLCRRKAPGTRVILANVICSLNYFEVLEMAKLAREVGADGIYLALLDPIAGRTDGLLLSPAQSMAVLEQVEGVRALGGLELENLEGFVRRLGDNDPRRGRYDRDAVERIPCYVGWIFCRILPNGDVCPCCRAVDLPLGNLHRASFGRIWYGERYNDFRWRAKVLPKSDPYFVPIGCYTTCDNLMHNEEVHRRIARLPLLDRRRILSLAGMAGQARGREHGAADHGGSGLYRV